MKIMTVGFSYHPTSALSWVIRKVTASKVSHTYNRISIGGDELIFQASGLTVNYTALPVFLEKNVVVEEYEVEISEDAWQEAKKFRKTQVGKPYAFKQLIGFIWVLGMRRLAGKHVSNPFGDGDHAHVCVEIVARCLKIDGGESMTPEDLRRWCEKNGNLITSRRPNE